jgi:hypothetical protein
LEHAGPKEGAYKQPGSLELYTGDFICDPKHYLQKRSEGCEDGKDVEKYESGRLFATALF